MRSASSGSGDRRRRAFFYACTARYNRGPEICPNVHKMRMEIADAEVIARIGDLLTPDLVVDIIARMREMLGQDQQEAHRGRIARELALTEDQVKRLSDAIAMGGDVPALTDRLHKAEQQRQELARAAKSIGDRPLVPRLDWRRIEAHARSVMLNWRAMLTRYASEGRVVLRQVLQSPVFFTPFEENGRRGYRFKGSASLVGLFEGTLEVIGMASPPGRQVLWRVPVRLFVKPSSRIRAR